MATHSFHFQAAPFQAAFDFDAPAPSAAPVETVTLEAGSYGLPRATVTLPLVDEDPDDVTTFRGWGLRFEVDGDVTIRTSYRIVFTQSGQDGGPRSDVESRMVSAWPTDEVVYFAKGKTNAGDEVVGQSKKSGDAARKNLARQIKQKNRIERVTASRLEVGDRIELEDGSEAVIAAKSFDYVRNGFGGRKSRVYEIRTEAGDVFKSNTVTRWDRLVG